MKFKTLRRVKSLSVYHFKKGKRIEGVGSRVTGNISDVYGDITNVYGDISGVCGDLDEITELPFNLKYL